MPQPQWRIDAIARARAKHPQPAGAILGATKRSGEINVFVIGSTGPDDRKGRFLIYQEPIPTRGMRTRYLYVNPRGFANEYSIYRVSTPARLADAQRIIAAHAGDTSGRACFISRGEADAKCRANRREAKMNVRGGLNLSQNPVACTGIVDLELSE